MASARSGMAQAFKGVVFSKFSDLFKRHTDGLPEPLNAVLTDNNTTPATVGENCVDVQTFAVPGATLAVPNSKASSDLKLARYIEPGPLWWALNWQDAAGQLAGTRVGGVGPEKPHDTWKPAAGSVPLTRICAPSFSTNSRWHERASPGATLRARNSAVSRAGRQIDVDRRLAAA